ncbi:MAG TPA: hypothetical protein VEV15_13165 [Flavisolibacter sp.]|nr:hypothetical protein [Flavisolibacter sp.]
MNKILTDKLAAYSLLTILSLVILFHLLVVVGVIPYNIVWGGRLKDKAELFQFEMVSIGTNLLMLLVVLVKAKILKVALHPKLLTIALWLMFALFILNTLGNLLSVNEWEKMIFTPLTLILALLCLKLALPAK